jgi:predicted MFS family arabinose efflux permease
LSAASIGLLYAVLAGLSAVIAFPAGILVDRSGSRGMLIAGLAISAVAQVLTISTLVPVIAAAQALSGAAWTAIQLSIVTAAINSVRPRQVGGVIGTVALASQSGLMAGPAIAGTLLGWIGFASLISLTAGVAVVAFGVAFVTVRDVGIRAGSDPEPPSSRQLLENAAIRQIAVLAVSTGIVWGTFQAYFALFASRGLHMQAVAIGWLVAVASLANGVSRIPAGRLLDKVFRKDWIIVAAVWGFAVSLALLPHMSGFWPTSLLLAFTVPLVSLAIMGMSVALAELGGTHGRGRALSVMYLVFNLASAAAPAVLAPAMNNSFTLGFAAASVTGAGLAGIALLMNKRTNTGDLDAPTNVDARDS